MSTAASKETYPRDQRSRESQDNRRRGSAATPIAVVSLFLAILAIILALILNSCVGTTASPTACVTEAPVVTAEAGETGAPGAAGPAGPSAYDLWLALGNTGTLEQFLDSLVGERGPSGVFIGSNGINGAAGATGATGRSAYQLWLDAGNSGSEQDFLDSLVGLGGADGAAGLSAYELWILEGNVGTIDDFFDSLVGLPGAPGATGAAGSTGLSAYEIWVENGGVGGVAEFLASLKGDTGATGPAGEPGICTTGEAGPSGATGATGANGLSAYDIWRLNGNYGSEELFLLSLIGPSGSPGPQGSAGPKGDTGATGPQGPPGIPGSMTGFGDSATFWDTTTQGHSGTVSTGIDTAYPMYFGQADATNNVGITVATGSGDEPGRASYITFTHPGVYNVAFSAQLLRTQGGSAATISIWLRKNGSNVDDTNTDVTLISNGQKQVAAWNFFVPVTCSPTCDTYQLMWSTDTDYTNLWYEAAQTSPTRPAIPSIILTVNQVK